MTDPKETLREMGVTPGSWGEAGGGEVRPKFVEDQLQLMLKLMGLLEQTERHLQGEMVRAKEALSVQKHGGASSNG